jgi:hypothetical protein
MCPADIQWIGPMSEFAIFRTSIHFAHTSQSDLCYVGQWRWQQPRTNNPFS